MRVVCAWEATAPGGISPFSSRNPLAPSTAPSTSVAAPSATRLNLKERSRATPTAVSSDGFNRPSGTVSARVGPPSASDQLKADLIKSLLEVERRGRGAERACALHSRRVALRAPPRRRASARLMASTGLMASAAHRRLPRGLRPRSQRSPSAACRALRPRRVQRRARCFSHQRATSTQSRRPRRRQTMCVSRFEYWESD